MYLKNKSSLLFVLTALTLLAQSNTYAIENIDRILAVVNDTVILESDLTSFRSKSANQPQQNIPEHQTLSKDPTMNQLILRKLQLDLALNNGIRISDSRLNQEVRALAQKNDLSTEDFISELEKEPGGRTEAFQYIRENLIIQQLQTLHLRSKIDITDQQARAFLATQAGKSVSRLIYTLGFISIEETILNEKYSEKDMFQWKQQLESEDNFEITSARLKSEHNALQTGSIAPKKLNDLPTIFAEVAPFLEVGEVSEPLNYSGKWYIAKLLHLTSENPVLEEQVLIRHILLQTSSVRNDKQAELQLAQIRNTILEKNNFTGQAQTFSEHLASKQQGGTFDWQPYSFFTPAFAEQIRTMQPGVISKPFRSEFGWHIAELLDTRQKDTSEQQELNRILDYLFQQKLNDEIPRWHNELLQSAYIDIREQSTEKK